MTEKKNGDYEKPESHGQGDDLEDVSGAGAGGKEDEPNPWKCTSGGALEACKNGLFHTW
jgi:hypothetical protein